METDRSCEYCKNTAKYICLCTQSTIRFCSEHQDFHLTKPGKHVIEIYKNNILVSGTKKLQIIRRIVEIRNEAHNNIVKALNHTKELIKKIKAQTKEVINNLEHFIKACDNNIIEIQNIKTISKKIFYTPLEKALTSDNTQCFIDTLAGSDIVLRGFELLLIYIPSPLHHSFNYYSSFSADYLTIDTLSIYPSGKILNINKFQWHSRILSIDFDTLLITGGAEEDNLCHNKCISLNINSGDIEVLPEMNSKRRWHAITWQSGFPCVIGGNDGTNILKNVEIFTGDEWTEISPLNTARSSSTAISHNGIMWCFGGVDENQRALDTIERFENDCWQIIGLRLSQPSYSLGVLCLENRILLYGGSDAGNNTLYQVHILDTNERSIFKVGNLNQGAYFVSNCLQIMSSQLVTNITEGLVVELNLQEIFS